MKKLLISFFCFAIIFSSNAQKNSLTTKDYEQAESFMGYNTQKYIDHGNVFPNWLTGDKFWYRSLTAQGSEFILVDPSRGTRAAAFDQQKLAAQIGRAHV